MRDFQVISSNLSIPFFIHPLCLARNHFCLAIFLSSAKWGGLAHILHKQCWPNWHPTLQTYDFHYAFIKSKLFHMCISLFFSFFTNSCLPSHFLSISLLYFLWYTILPYPCRAVVVIWFETWLDAHFQQSVCANRRIIKYRPHSNQIVVLQNYKIVMILLMIATVYFPIIIWCIKFSPSCCCFILFWYSTAQQAQ